jgi:hypothetical protein
MIPREWAFRLTPVPSKLYVRRVEQPQMRGRLYLPDGAENYRRMTRSQEAFVMAAGEGVPFEPGQRVLLAETVGREIHFGFRGEVKFLEISPYQVLAVLRDAPEQPLALRADPLRGVEGEVVEAGLQEPKFEEGSSEGLL